MLDKPTAETITLHDGPGLSARAWSQGRRAWWATCSCGWSSERHEGSGASGPARDAAVRHIDATGHGAAQRAAARVAKNETKERQP